MTIQFFIAMQPPTITAQQHKVTVVKGKPRFYDPRELKEAKEALKARLAKFAPEVPYTGGIRLTTRWCFPVVAGHKDGEYRTTRPDTENIQKALKDVMTDLRFWKDDALVASELIEKFWAEVPGLFIRIEPL